MSDRFFHFLVPPATCQRSRGRSTLHTLKFTSDLNSDKLRSGGIPIDELAKNFSQHMNPPTELPWQFDMDAYTSDLLFNNVIPPETTDVTLNLDFTRPFTIDKIDEVKCHIHSRSLRSARGADDMSYQRILEIELDDLAALFNECIHSLSCPSARWLVTILVGIQKKGKPIDVADSYCIIVLDCSSS